MQGVSRPLRFVFYVLPALIWMVIIFGNSTDVGSSAHTRTFLQEFLANLPPLSHLSFDAILEIDHVIRKTAHVTEYAIFATLLFRALRQNRNDWRPLYAWGPVLFAFLYASTDEIHQIFVPSRGASVVDVLIDTSGAILGTTLCALWVRAKMRCRSAVNDANE